MASEATHEQDAGHADDDHGHGSADFAHPSPVRTLLATFFALILLTILTVVLASAFEMGRFEVWASLGIATVKATLVLLFFMHLLHDKPFNAMFFLSSVLFVVLFIGMLLMDTDQYKADVEALDPAELPAHKIGNPFSGN